MKSYPDVIYDCDDDLVKFGVRFDQEAQHVTIRSGRNGFAGLLRTCHFHATSEGSKAFDHSHWKTTQSEPAEIITRCAELPFVNASAGLGPRIDEGSSTAPHITILYPESPNSTIILDHETSPQSLYIHANQAGMCTMANALVELLLQPYLNEAEILCSSTKPGEEQPILRFELDESFDHAPNR